MTINETTGLIFITNATTGISNISNAEFVNKGSIEVNDCGAGVVNSATMDLQTSSLILIDNVTTAEAVRNTTASATLNFDGDLSILNTAAASNILLNHNSATITGSGGFFFGDLLDNDATISPGSSPGSFIITGDLDSSDPNSTIIFEIDGNAGAGVDPMGHDQIVVSGTTTLGAGTIRTLTNGFTPGDFDCYTVIDSGTLNGIFGTEDQPDYLFNILYDQGGNGDVQTCGISVLDVDILEFNAEYNLADKSTLLSWQTASESNHDYFELEASKNGSRWQSFESVQSTGSHSTYVATHNSPSANSEGKLYYRLKMVDLDKLETFSSIEVITIPNEREVLIWPNPINRDGKLTIDGIDVHSLKVFDNQGRIVASGSRILESISLSAGTYHLIINDELRKVIVVLP